MLLFGKVRMLHHQELPGEMVRYVELTKKTFEGHRPQRLSFIKAVWIPRIRETRDLPEDSGQAF